MLNRRYYFEETTVVAKTETCANIKEGHQLHESAKRIIRNQKHYLFNLIEIFSHPVRYKYMDTA